MSRPWTGWRLSTRAARGGHRAGGGPGDPQVDNKTVGTIVIPVFIDTDEDAETALDSSVFKPVWDVIKALRAHDTELGEQRMCAGRWGRKGGKPRHRQDSRDVPASVSRDFLSMHSRFTWWIRRPRRGNSGTGCWRSTSPNTATLMHQETFPD